jgi:ATP-dependent protease ClpP protease subunit
MNPKAQRLHAFSTDAIPAVLEERQANVGATPLTVEAINNHVYFYSDVDEDRALALMRSLRDVDGMLRNERISRDIPPDVPPTPIWLHIHSYGGSVFAGLNLADQIKSIHTPIYSVVEGCCASAATLISMTCTRRYIRPSSFMLIHQLSAIAWGTHEQFKDEMKLQEMLMQRLYAFYEKHSKIANGELVELLKRDWWINAEQALQHGLVDEILGGA